MGSFEISRAGIYPKYPEETVLFPVYTTRQRNFALYVTGVIFTYKYFKFGLNTTGLSQPHFRNLSACSITREIHAVKKTREFHDNKSENMKVHGPDIRALHSKNSGKRAYRLSREIESL